ncbi:multiple epidermal growth factor-like domains protein 10 isoform X2 [Cryptotermes secundus]|uniref:multiple epidermal growth factor-like domains protein 10 isoform X2 n=1 Tax=Cryptotermes secundus TaxID=105785 RepID=UPI001454E021|nr:multiple epidermal growth factor-like domains protein 10 isoform X2 [Cryptotermes secundus]
MTSAADVLLCSVVLLLVATCEAEGINALIGEECEVDRNCISAQMLCPSTGRCECWRGHYPTEDRRNCIATTSGLCFDNSDCRSLLYSSCFIRDSFDGSCTCSDGYSSSEDERECLPDMGYQETCKEAVQCESRLVDNAVCREGKCGCQVNYHYSTLDGRCIRDVRLLEPCVNSSQCVTSNQHSKVECRDNRCSCPEGYEQIQDYCRGYNFKSIGGGAFIHRGNSANDESNGDGASNLQVSVAALSVYWVVQLVAA